MCVKLFLKCVVEGDIDVLLDTRVSFILCVRCVCGLHLQNITFRQRSFFSFPFSKAVCVCVCVNRLQDLDFHSVLWDRGLFRGPDFLCT